MSSKGDIDVEAICETIRKDYSPCDVSDALLTLGVPLAGHLLDIAPLPTHATPSPRIVAPISTVLFVPNTHRPLPSSPSYPYPTANISTAIHWTDRAPPNSIVLLSAPPTSTVAVVGDIVATRYKTRGIAGVVIDGRSRDVLGCNALCADGTFQVWSKGLSSVGTSMELQPWAVDVEVDVGGVKVRAGDLFVGEAGERVCCVVPRERVRELIRVLPGLKRADDGVLADVKGGMGFKEALGRWPGHYTNVKH